MNIFSTHSNINEDILKIKYRDTSFTMIENSNEMNIISYKVSQLPISEEEKRELTKELQALSPDDRNEIFHKITNESTNSQKIQLNNLLNEFGELRNQGNLKEALNILEKILELSESQGNSIIFEKFLLEYNIIRTKLDKH